MTVPFAATFTRRSSSGGGGGGGSVSIPDTKIPTGIYEHALSPVSPKSASKCDTVTPTRGYVLESLTVLDKDGRRLSAFGASAAAATRKDRL